MADAKEQAKEAIRTTLTEVKQFLAQEAPPKLSEADTKANFIEPLLPRLGWSGIGVVAREYYVKNSQEFIDYVMRDAGTPLLAIEAKAIQVELTEKAAAQLVQYCVVEGIEWAALTNGRELRFFNTYLKGDLAAKLILRLDLLAFNSEAEYDALFDQLWLLSRESMTTPAGVRTWLEHHRMDQALRAVLHNPASHIVTALQAHLSDKDIKATSEDIVAWFRGQLPANVTPFPVLVRPTQGERAKPNITQPAPSTVAKATDVDSEGGYYLFPAGPRGDLDACAHLKRWLDRGMWGVGQSTAHRKALHAGDHACFYARGVGIVATAVIAGEADSVLPVEEKPTPSDEVTFRVPLQDVAWLTQPLEIDSTIRSSLDAFAGKDVSKAWGWFVQSTSQLSPHDFLVHDSSDFL